MLAIAFDTSRLISHLDVRLSAALRHCDEVADIGLLSITLSLPELTCLQFTKMVRGNIYWSNPQEQHQRIATGRAASIKTRGNSRFDRLERRFNRLCNTWHQLDPENVGNPTHAFVGFSFNPNEGMHHDWRGFSNACIHIPSVLLERKGAVCNVTFTARFGMGKEVDEIRYTWLREAQHLFERITCFNPGYSPPSTLHRIADAPSEDEWLARVNKALKAINRGAFEKVVLARRVRLASRRPLHPARTLSWLAAQHPGGVQFAYTTAHSCLIGASPERLVSLRGEKVVSDAVAGTVRCESTAERNRKLGYHLFSDHKARYEQDLVVKSIMRALDPLCVSINAPVEPQLLESARVQHLWSPIHGRVKRGVSLLRLASNLHPTPAVGGTPCAQAIAWLETKEREQRGWYTGALGWMTPNGGGELVVILRCALLRNNIADLFAGAGIVGDSNPRAELNETEWKLQTMLDALAAT
jgi:isochorismate synthase